MTTLAFFFYVSDMLHDNRCFVVDLDAVCNIHVALMAVVCASPPCPPEIFPIKIADLPQKWPFLPNFPFFPYVILYLKFKFGNRGGGVRWGEMFSKKLGKNEIGFQNSRVCFLGVPSLPSSTRVYTESM